MDRKEKFNRAQLGGSSEKKGGDYYLNQRIYLGNKYIELALEQYHRQRISKQQLAEYLDIRIKSLSRLEDVFYAFSP